MFRKPKALSAYETIRIRCGMSLQMFRNVMHVGSRLSWSDPVRMAPETELTAKLSHKGMTCFVASAPTNVNTSDE
jgi:hypothetical protein